jgi:hypothetical protein
LLLFEDAHWADSTSLELLDRIVECLPHLPVLLVMTCRPEYASPWVGRPQVTMLALDRLGGRETVALVNGVARGKRLPAEILERIIERTDGIPLFIEELTKSLMEGGLLREEAEGYVLSVAARWQSRRACRPMARLTGSPIRRCGDRRRHRPRVLMSCWPRSRRTGGSCATRSTS